MFLNGDTALAAGAIVIVAIVPEAIEEGQMIDALFDYFAVMVTDVGTLVLFAFLAVGLVIINRWGTSC